MRQTFKRVQMLIEPNQHRTLVEYANRKGKSVSEVTRQAIQLGIEVLEMEEQFARRRRALERAKTFRRALRARTGKPTSIDVVDDLQQLRENRDEGIASSRD